MPPAARSRVTMKTTLLRLFLVASLALPATAADAPPPGSAPLEPVYLPQIQFGGFWKAQAKRITCNWLPHCIAQMEKGGRGRELLNLVAAGRKLRGQPAEGKYTGAPWSDAYIYNTVEAACMALAVAPGGDVELARAQERLRAKLEEWIPIILGAQAEDGYIHSFHVVNGHPRYSNLDWHEFYVMGYFLEMGVAHFEASGGKDRRLLDAALRCANHLCDTFGPAPKRTWRNGHPGLEYALCRLGRLVNRTEGAGRGDRYIDLARHFVAHQHEGGRGSEYNQADKPAVAMSEARGHAVRATYFYTAMTDIALLRGDRAMGEAADRLWANAIHRKHYLTGGVGASHDGEAFDADYVLPNDGYCESCAGCGLSFWADRMHRLHRGGHYRDVQERVLYNNLLGALELSGKDFFYQNPLQSEVARYPWHGCPCCVGNIPRALLGIKDAIYSVDRQRGELFVNHYVDCEAEVPATAGAALRIRQETAYPWEGRVVLTLHPAAPATFILKLRIPDRTESELYTTAPDLDGRFELRLNGQPRSPQPADGYVALPGPWRDGDRVELVLPMDVQRVRCDARVRANRGRVALQRGPVVYSVEDIDHRVPARELVLAPAAALAANWRPDLLGGIMVVEGGGLTAVPNYARLNRGGGSLVWITEDPAEVEKVAWSPPDQLPGFARIVARTLDAVAVGHQRSEQEHKLAGERTVSGSAFGYHWRHAGDGWFSYRMRVAPAGAQAVFCSYWGGDAGNRRFTILVDGREVGRQVLDSPHPGRFFAAEYPIPQDLTRGKREVTVKLQADPGSTAGGVFDLRILKAEP